MLFHRFEKLEHTLDVRADKLQGAHVNGTINMCLGGEINDVIRLMLSKDTSDFSSIGDISLDKNVSRGACEFPHIVAVAGVCEFIVVDDAHAGVPFEHVPDEVGADKACSARDQNGLPVERHGGSKPEKPLLINGRGGAHNRYTTKVDQPFSEEEFRSIYSRVPRLCVDLIVRTPRGVVLTLRSLPSWHGLWHMPGGTILYRETVKEAAERVARREIGVSVKILHMLGYMEFPREEKTRGYGYSISIVLLCDLIAGELFEKTDEASEIKAWAELPEQMMPEHKEFFAAHWDEIRSGLF